MLRVHAKHCMRALILIMKYENLSVIIGTVGLCLGRRGKNDRKNLNH
jgi:hypothetical protein